MSLQCYRKECLLFLDKPVVMLVFMNKPLETNLISVLKQRLKDCMENNDNTIDQGSNLLDTELM